MKGNGSVVDAQVLALKHGQIMIAMKVILKMIKRTEKELILQQMVIVNIMVNGKMIFKMDMGLKLGLIIHNMKEIMKMDKSKDKVDLFGEMVVHMKDYLQII